MARVIYIIEYFNEDNEWETVESFDDYDNAVAFAESEFPNQATRLSTFKEEKSVGEVVDYSNTARPIENLKKPEYSVSFKVDSGWKSLSQNPYAYAPEDE